MMAPRTPAKAYLVGGGIACLASATYLIRDGGMAGEDICIFDANPIPGGSLDGAGSPEEGYVMRGGRMLTDEAYTCTFDLLSFIPSLQNPADTVTSEIRAFNARHITDSHARLVCGGAKVNAVRPLAQWLRDQGVRFEMGARVLDLEFKDGAAGARVALIRYIQDRAVLEVRTGPHDVVFVTNGSMTAGSSSGSMTRPARFTTDDADGSWALWETLARKHPEFGRPDVFHSEPEKSRWLSFTVTQKDPLFFQLMEDFTGNEAGTGGLVTLIDSNWLMSVVLAHQPHFIGQPADVNVFWGYGLYGDKSGNFVPKSMFDCNGAELLRELLGHLRLDTYADRPPVRPPGTTNLAFVGQFCEIPDDVVFTVEYSVRSAQTAVYSLLGMDKSVAPLHKGQHHLKVDLSALRTLLR